jgi:glucose-6-phosphate 1-dehydrogenase
MVQNHVLQMLALIAMDEPKDMAAENIRNEKVKVLKALQPIKAQDICKDVARGQYANYQTEVGHKSQTETFVVLKASLKLARRQGTSFFLKTGKSLNKKLTEISIHFKEPIKCLFAGCSPNILTFRIQPNESVRLQINNKIPGFGITLHKGNLELSYEEAFPGEIPSAYERLLLDFLEGDQRLFIRSDEIIAAWKFIDSIYTAWNETDCPVHSYADGGNGPEEAEKFIQDHGQEWWTK